MGPLMKSNQSTKINDIPILVTFILADFFVRWTKVDKSKTGADKFNFATREWKKPKIVKFYGKAIKAKNTQIEETTNPTHEQRKRLGGAKQQQSPAKLFHIFFVSFKFEQEPAMHRRFPQFSAMFIFNVLLLNK